MVIKKGTIHQKIYSKYKEEFSNIMSTNQKGSRNSQYGKIWIYNEELRLSKKIKSDDYIEDGWIKGRKIDFSYLDNVEYQNKVKLKDSKVDIANFYYKLYDMYGFNTFVSLTNYKHTKQNLIAMFIRYVENFKPQNGKKRGK